MTQMLYVKDPVVTFGLYFPSPLTTVKNQRQEEKSRSGSFRRCLTSHAAVVEDILPGPVATTQK